MKNNTIEFSLLWPGGNTTALVKGLFDKERRIEINGKLMRSYPQVEQVGFYRYDGKAKNAQLQMAGGEFCGNALRSLAYLLLDGEKGEITFKVSSVKEHLKAGVRTPRTSYSQIPFYKNTKVVFLNQSTKLIKLPGITYIIKPAAKTQKDPKKTAKALLKSKNLLLEKAAGVIFTTAIEKPAKIVPVVWVRDIKTFFVETACASGSAAVAMLEALSNNSSKNLLLVQPSGETIRVSVLINKKIEQVEISGSTKILEKKLFL